MSNETKTWTVGATWGRQFDLSYAAALAIAKEWAKLGGSVFLLDQTTGQRTYVARG